MDLNLTCPASNCPSYNSTSPSKWLKWVGRCWIMTWISRPNSDLSANYPDLNPFLIRNGNRVFIRVIFKLHEKMGSRVWCGSTRDFGVAWYKREVDWESQSLVIWNWFACACIGKKRNVLIVQRVVLDSSASFITVESKIAFYPLEWINNR